jgi:hypothetical protein
MTKSGVPRSVTKFRNSISREWDLLLLTVNSCEPPSLISGLTSGKESYIIMFRRTNE